MEVPIELDLLVVGGTVVTPEAVFRANVGVHAGKIVAIGTDLGSARQTVNATDCYVLPGAVDVHTHFDAIMHGSRSPDDFYYGTVSAACGGVTCIVDFAKGQPGQSLEAMLEDYHQRADGRAVVDYGFSPIIFETPDTLWASLPALIRAGYPTFKVFTTYDFRVTDPQLLRLLEIVSEHGGMLCVHAEDDVAIEYLTARLIADGKLAPKYHAVSRPSEVERDGVLRVVQLLRLIGGGSVYIVHVSSAAALGAVQAARDEGLSLYGETCPRYLAFTKELYEQPFERAARYVLTPPLRTAADQRALLAGLRNGALSAVSSDHICFLDADKARGRENFALIPNGAPAIETMLSTVYPKAVATGEIDLSRWVAVMSTLPAKLFGLFPQKGTLSVGGDADIVIFDPHKRWVVDHTALHNRCDFALDEGMELIGAPVTTISRGEIIWNRGRFEGRPGRGQFIARGTPVAV